MSSFADNNKMITEVAFDNPQVGDRFTEMFNYWLYVVARDGEQITTMEAIAPCTLPDDGEIRTYATVEEFRARFRYGGTTPGYWVRLIDRDHDVSGWLRSE